MLNYFNRQYGNEENLDKNVSTDHNIMSHYCRVCQFALWFKKPWSRPKAFVLPASGSSRQERSIASGCVSSAGFWPCRALLYVM
jgi:hypothetical protein